MDATLSAGTPTSSYHPCDCHLQVLDKEVAWFWGSNECGIAMIVQVGQQRPQLLGKVALLGGYLFIEKPIYNAQQKF